MLRTRLLAGAAALTLAGTVPAAAQMADQSEADIVGMIYLEANEPTLTYEDGQLEIHARAVKGTNLLDADFENSLGQEIGSVSDVILDKYGAAEAIMFEGGPAWGLFGGGGIVGFDRVDLQMAGGREPTVEVMFDNPEMRPSDRVTVTRDEADDLMLSNLIGSEVLLTRSERSLEIEDVIFSRDGQARFVILGEGDWMDDDTQIAAPIGALIDSGDRVLRLAWTPTQLAALPPVDY